MESRYSNFRETVYNKDSITLDEREEEKYGGDSFDEREF